MKFMALIKKEFHRFFHDPRLIVTMLLPGIIIFLIYTVMGNVIGGSEVETYTFKVYLSGQSAVTQVIETAAESAGHTLEWLPLEDEEEARAAVKSGEATAILAFSENFDGFDGAERGEVKLIYDAMEQASSFFYALSASILEQYGMRFAIVSESLSTDDAIGVEVMTQILPFLLVCFIFSACMSVTLESVAGEKERGTLATILVTSAKRSHIALGKLVPLSCISMLGALSSFLGVALSMPKLMGVSLGFLGGYSVWSYILLLVLILSTVPLVVGAIASVSALSRSVKEATAYTSVLMIFTMVISLVAAFIPAIGDWVVFIPVLNAVVVMQGVLAGGLPVWQSLVGVGLNLAYTALLVFAMTKMLSSEKIIFGK